MAFADKRIKEKRFWLGMCCVSCTNFSFPVIQHFNCWVGFSFYCWWIDWFILLANWTSKFFLLLLWTSYNNIHIIYILALSGAQDCLNSYQTACFIFFYLFFISLVNDFELNLSFYICSILHNARYGISMTWSQLGCSASFMNHSECVLVSNLGIWKPSHFQSC